MNFQDGHYRDSSVRFSVSSNFLYIIVWIRIRADIGFQLTAHSCSVSNCLVSFRYLRKNNVFSVLLHFIHAKSEAQVYKELCPSRRVLTVSALSRIVHGESVRSRKVYTVKLGAFSIFQTGTKSSNTSSTMKLFSKLDKGAFNAGCIFQLGTVVLFGKFFQISTALLRMA
jgi:hypothetical protein